MIFSDLIDELVQESADEGVLGSVTKKGSFGLKIFEANINTPLLSKKFGKAMGRYVTVNISPTMHSYHKARVYLQKQLALVLDSFCDKKKGTTFLVVGLGNAFVVSDSIGSQVVKNLFATHNIISVDDFELGDMACLIPGVSGINGIYTFDLVKSAINIVQPNVVIVIDALTAKNYHRLGNSFQFSNAGITPGGGVGNKNTPLCKRTLGVEVISIGVPMMINARNFSQLEELPNIVLTPKEIDIFTATCAKILSKVINTFVHGDNYKNFM